MVHQILLLCVVPLENAYKTPNAGNKLCFIVPLGAVGNLPFRENHLVYGM